MISLDPVTLGDCGYPRFKLANTGYCNHAPLEDRTHPHPLIMDFSAVATRRLGRAALVLRAGLAGEPAFGPPSYMHRASAALDPIAPLGQHETNPFHVVNGLVTGSVSMSRAAVEVSAFNGRAGDDDPYDLDLAPLHAWAGRASWKLAEQTAAQLSVARLNAAAAGHAAHTGAEPGKLTILSGSLVTAQSRGNTTADATLAWNRQLMEGMPNNDVLLAEVRLRRGRHALSLRGELVERTERVGEHTEAGHVEQILETQSHELSAGYAVRVMQRIGFDSSMGVRGALTFVPAFWQPTYGRKRAESFAVFLNLQPTRHHH